VIHRGDPCNEPSSSEGRERLFGGRYERLVLEGVGHVPQREAPETVAAAIARFLGTSPR